MNRGVQASLFVVVAAIFAPPMSVPQSKTVTVTIAEPATVRLEDFFKQADTVALVKTVSGDTENYDTAVYKAQVQQSFKGTSSGATIYFGPYVGERLGWEYVVFLRTSDKPLLPRMTSTGYGQIRYAEILNQGYGAMETSYTCVFGRDKISEQCDYAVRICTDYIKPPNSLPTVPAKPETTSFGCRWVKKSLFIEILQHLGKQSQ